MEAMTSGITQGQRERVADVFGSAGRKGAVAGIEEAIAESCPTKDVFQSSILEDPTFARELQEEYKRIAREKALSRLMPKEFADEEVESEYRYLSGYSVSKGILNQTAIIRSLLLNFNGEVNAELAAKIESGEIKPNSVSEGFFAMPHWSKLAPTYGEAVAIVVDLLKKTRGDKFYDVLSRNFGPKFLQQTEKKRLMIDDLLEKQGSNIIIFQAQFGILHRGRSVRRARVLMLGSQFGLGIYEVAWMLLTHPERLQHFDDLYIDCAGDSYAPDGDGVFDCAPCFRFDGGRVGLVYGDVDDVLGRSGSASGWPPQ